MRINKQSLLKSIILAAMMFCPEGIESFLSGREGQAKQAFAEIRSKQGVKITITYDNNPFDRRLRAESFAKPKRSATAGSTLS